jgi:hypothetical protein
LHLAHHSHTGDARAILLGVPEVEGQTEQRAERRYGVWRGICVCMREQVGRGSGQRQRILGQGLSEW